MVDRLTVPAFRNRFAYTTAFIGPVVLGAALYPTRGHIVPANLALIFVVFTVATSSLGIRGAAGIAAVASGLSFDYFCTVPYLTLRMSRPSDITTTVLLLVVGLAVGQVAVSARRAREEADAGADRLRRIHALSEHIASGSDISFIVAAVARELRDLLALRDCRFTRGRVGQAGARIQGDGSVSIGSHLWKVEQLGLPTRRVLLPVRNRSQVLGSFILTPTPALPIQRDRCLTAVALADELGAALSIDRLVG
jgi:Domain of unknown function (DUF4118)